MTRRLHVAYVCGDRGVPVGGYKGASIHVGEMVRALISERADVQVVAARVANPIDRRFLPAPVIDVGGSKAARQARQVLYAAAGGAGSDQHLTEVRALLLNQPMAKALERLNATWRIDAIYERYSLWSFAAAGVARAARIPFVLEVNAPLCLEQKRYRQLANEAAARDLEGYLLRSADCVVVPSRQLADFVRSRGVPAKRVRVIPNAADPARYDPRIVARRRASGEFRERFVVGFVGSLKPWHGIDQLMKAFRILYRRWSGYRLLIVGDGPLRPQLERTARDMGIAGAVEFTGGVGPSEVPALLARMDAAVAPYAPLKGFYFSPIKIYEYMAAGVPIVASDIGQISEVLDHGKTALLQKPGAVRELAERIDELRRRPALAERLASAARRKLCRNYTWRRNARRVLDLVRRIGEEKRG